MSTVEHKGIVRSIRGRDIEVEICRSSACGSCESRGFCGVESTAQTIWVRDSSATVQVGDEVTVEMAESAGIMAVLWGYLVPLVVFLTALILLVQVTGREGLSGVLALFLLAPYYLILWLLRGRMKRSFSFHIKKVD